MKSGSYIYNPRTGNKERIGRIVQMHANTRKEIESVSSGNWCYGSELKTFAQETHSVTPDHAVILEEMTFPEPVISIAIEPKTKADQEKNGNIS